MLLTTATAWAENQNITTNITYNGLTASDVTFTFSGNETSFELRDGETTSVDVPFFPPTTCTITCTSTKSLDAVSYSITSWTGEQVEFTSDGNNGCSFEWWPNYSDLTLTITVYPGEAPLEGITMTQDGSINMPTSGTTTANIPDGVTKFYVYDDGGPDGNYSNGCNGQLLLIAPEGKVLKVNGTVTGGDNTGVGIAEFARLAVYDGSSTSAMLYHNSYGSVSNITSSDRQMLLHFYDIDWYATTTHAGLSLTVEVVEPTTAHNITIADGITHSTVTADKTSATVGETVTLTVTTDVGYELGYFTGVTPTSIGNNQYTFLMPADDVTISASINVSSLFGYKYHYGYGAMITNYIPDGSADYPYIISTAEGWNLLCDCLAEENNTTWNRFSGKTVVLGNDIEVSRMAGSDSHDFCSTFDGQGNTLTFNHGTSGSYANDEYTAPFSYVSNTKANPSDAADSPATIKNLHVAGDIYTQAKYAAGIVGQHWGTLNVENCRSSIVIHSSVTNNDGNDGTHGGIEAVSNGVLNITGCVFDGKIVSTNGTSNCGGFVGWRAAKSNQTISNSLFAPSDDANTVSTGCYTFLRNPGSYTTITNSYYTRTLGTAQGKAPLTVTAGENVTVQAVNPVGNPVADGTYSVSGITAYAKGITRTVGETTTFYYGSGDEVSLTLDHSDRMGYTFEGYEASSATLSGVTLTMPNADVTINATWSENVLELSDATSNVTAIADAAATGKTYNRVILQGRTLQKNGSWNTLCLPFAMTAEQMAASPLAGATIKELDATNTSLNTSTGELTLAFTEATATSIEAGKPYIVKWTTAGDNITDPVFSGVTISSTTPAEVTSTTDGGKVKFVGQYSPFSIGDTSNGTYDGDINEILYIASGNRIGYASKERTLKCFRAHFWVQPNGTQQAARMISIDLGDGETTGISLTPSLSPKGDESEYYDLQGRKVTKPTQKGLYMINGRKVVVK